MRKWIRWLHRQFKKTERENRQLLTKEFHRKRPGKKAALKDKWKLTVRLYSDSHSIRAKPLNDWNTNSQWLHLRPVGGRHHHNEMLVDFTLPRAVPMQALFWHGWGVARQFVVALNIGTMGFFWWYLPKLRSRYYEKLMDLEANSEVKLERSPALKLDWGHAALSSSDLSNTAVCFAFLPKPNDDTSVAPFNHYVGGLTFLGINDINYKCETHAYGNFYHSLKTGMRIYKAWNGRRPFLESMEKTFASTRIEKASLEQCFELGESVIRRKRRTAQKDITLREVGMVKVLCDAFFLRTFRDMANARAELERAQ